MRIIIFSDAFLAPAYLPRIRYFCSYFAEKGYQISLITEGVLDKKMFPEDIDLFPIIYLKNKVGFKAKIEWLYKFLLNLFIDHKGRFFFKKTDFLLREKQFDVVFCTTFFTFPLTVAHKISKKYHLPLHLDLRDILEQSSYSHNVIHHQPPIFKNTIITIFNEINIKRRNKVLNSADCVTTVSPWHVQTLSKYNPNTHLIYNGFDESKFLQESLETDKFVISYFGQIYSEQMRNPKNLFMALHNLEDRGLLAADTVTIKFFVDKDSKNIVDKIAKECAVENFIEYLDFIEPEKLSSEMNKSSVLLVLCNIESEIKYYGIMTTKFFEAVGTNRPVLCTPNNNDDLAHMIKEINCGLVSSDVSEIEDYVLNKYQEWERTGGTKAVLDEEIRMNFSRKKGAEILEKLFYDSIKSFND